MMFTDLVITAFSCLVLLGGQHCDAPVEVSASEKSRLQPVAQESAVDVVLSAEAALVWDVESGAILYEKNATVQRPIASLTKLLSVLTLREKVSDDAVILIPPEVRRAQQLGAHIKLPVGEHVYARDLFAASLIASANDAVVALAVATYGSEEAFAQAATAFARQHGISQTQASNATGLSGGDQFSTASDVRTLLSLVYADPTFTKFLAAAEGDLTTIEGTYREFDSTNDLLKTYVPIIAAKTGYTVEAGQNLAIMTVGAQGQEIGAVVLGSTDRFYDMKVLVEWVWRHFVWS